MLLRRRMVSQDGRQIGRRSAYQFWPRPSSLWHVLLVGSLKASACLPRHTPPQYPWLKCDWRSQCWAKLAAQRLCWVMLITQTHCQCRHDWKQHIMQDIASQEIWELWIQYRTAEMKPQIVLLWHNPSFRLLNMHLGTRQRVQVIYCVSGAGGNLTLFVRPLNNISVPWRWSFVCI